MPDFTVRPPADENEMDALAAILKSCFLPSPESWAAYEARLGPEGVRVVLGGDRVQGGCALLPMEQWFAGRRVPAVGIAAVGTAPEDRGGGAAKALMVAVVREARERGWFLSPLWPSTQALYRTAGYEAAGDRLLLWIEPAKIGVRDRTVPARRIRDPDPARLAAIRSRWAARRSGSLTRHASIWDESLEFRGGELHVYEIGPESSPEGYTIFHQKRGAEGQELWVRDVVALTPGALRRIWSLFAAHSTLVRRIYWPTWPAGPELLLLPEPRWRSHGHDRWMLRIVDPAEALRARGYPAGCEAKLDLAVEDAVFDETVRLRLDVSEGRADVGPGGDGGLRLDVRALAPLYTGHTTARELREMGRLEGDDAAIAAADRIFAGPAPCMLDFF